MRVSGNFLPVPPYRSWPFPRDRLERIAFAAGMDDEELHSLLHDAIQVRLRERGEAWHRLDTTLEKRANCR
jgi:hypothetical protein